jgi:type IV pilus assembly protein PilC
VTIKAAIFCPCAVISIAMIIITVLMIWVVPRFEPVFQDLPGGGRLPGFTQAVLSIRHGLTSHLGWVVSGLAILGLSMPAIGRTRRGR